MLMRGRLQLVLIRLQEGTIGREAALRFSPVAVEQIGQGEPAVIALIA